jgi:hypothetical protein
MQTAGWLTSTITFVLRIESLLRNLKQISATMDKFHLSPNAPPRPQLGPKPVVRNPAHDDHLSVRSVIKSSMENRRAPSKLVLCFDGTGNKFKGDDSDSNILKIFRCLDRTAGNQCR